jgi:hypothetical protein
MTPLAAIAWAFGIGLFFIAVIWAAVRSIRWARRGTK